MRQALEMALDWIKKQPEETPHSKYDVDTRYVVIREIEAALAQPEQPKVRTGDCLLVGVCASEGHKIQKAQPEQEPVAMRMPKVGDKVICIEDDSLGEVAYLTAGGSPEIKFDDGSHGTYMLREFAELFRYATTPPQHIG